MVACLAHYLMIKNALPPDPAEAIVLDPACGLSSSIVPHINVITFPALNLVALVWIGIRANNSRQCETGISFENWVQHINILSNNWQLCFIYVVNDRRGLLCYARCARHNKSNMADGRHFENRYMSIRESSEYDEIWYADAHFDQGDGNVRKFQKLPNSRRLTDAILKIIFGYNSASYCPIKTKFGVRRHNRTHRKVRWWKCQISKIQHGGRPPFWKSLYLHNSATNRPNWTKFSMRTQILSHATETWLKIRNSPIQDDGRTPNHRIIFRSAP